MEGRYLVVDVQQEVVEGNTYLFLLLSCFAKLILFYVLYSYAVDEGANKCKAKLKVLHELSNHSRVSGVPRDEWPGIAGRNPFP